MTDTDASQLLLQHEYLEAGFALAIRRAGQGPESAFERRLNAQARALRTLLDDPAAAGAVNEAIDAAHRVMDAAEPDAPLRMLAMARENLARYVRRQTFGRHHRQAA